VPTAHQSNQNNKSGFNHADSPLEGAAEDLADFHRRFAPFFQTKTRNVSIQSYQYFKGLFQSPKKNMERIAEVVPNSNDQSFQHFLSNSPWDEDAVIEKVAIESNKAIGSKADSFLIIGETGIPKKGTKSVGVARQYCGELGKVENCQVGVFLTLGYREHVVPIDCRSYLPKSWAEDEGRCLATGVPEDFIEFHRKQDLALQMVIAARARGIGYSWIGCDGFYGENPSLLRFLDDLHEVFMADVYKDQRVYLEDPKPRMFPKPNRRRGASPAV